ncbi:MAG: hypothetical protein P9F19_03670 [Candidatus Contendobacter sp.]|nr:hypothetical protein [Candidatus Contendobacter sp.]MDG4556485.1 hypothetical protein [Candidatus Contendobacter sp.]
MPGCIIASPSIPGDIETNQDHVHFWARDSALTELTDLQTLRLMDTKVADPSPLAGLAELRFLNLNKTMVTAAPWANANTPFSPAPCVPSPPWRLALAGGRMHLLRSRH